MSDQVQATEQKTEGGEEQHQERTFTQSEVESIIRGRLAKFADYDDLKREVEELRKANQTEQERAVAEARAEARREALAEVNRRIVSAEARALAAEFGWLYPQDAPLYIKPEDVPVGDDGTVDADALKTALSEAVRTRPALLRDADERVPDPSNAGLGVVAQRGPLTPEEAWARDLG